MPTSSRTGNWEFGFGPAVLCDRVSELAFPMIASNVQRADSGEPEFAPGEIREVGGIRIAFIGITSPIVSRSMPRAFGAGLRFLDALDVLPEMVATVRDRERPDIVVVLVSHYGFAQEVTRVQQLEIAGAPAEPDSEYMVPAAGEQSVRREGEEGRTLTSVMAIDSLRAYLATHRPVEMPVGCRSLVAV